MTLREKYGYLSEHAEDIRQLFCPILVISTNKDNCIFVDGKYKWVKNMDDCQYKYCKSLEQAVELFGDKECLHYEYVPVSMDGRYCETVVI